jgi:hypothetical protein
MYLDNKFVQMYFDHIYIYTYYTPLPGLRSLKYLLFRSVGSMDQAILRAMEQRSGNRSDEDKQVQRCL